VTKEFIRFNTIGTHLTVRLNPPSSETAIPDHVSHFLASVNNLFEHVLQNVNYSDMVGIVFQNETINDKPIGISFRRKDQLSGDAVWNVFDKVSSNSRFNAL
jgi:hypothetical protein